jgi:hypothetical protein
MIRYLEQTPRGGGAIHDLLVTSLSRNGEITDQEWDILREKESVEDARLLHAAGSTERTED